MRFGDIVTCVALMAVISALIGGPLEMLLFSAFGISSMSNWGYGASLIVSFLLGGLITGYIFAEKIWEARRGAITKITVLWAAFVSVLTPILLGTAADSGPWIKEAYQAATPGTTLSTKEWVDWELMYLDSFVSLMVVVALVLGFIGLYAGSMLRRPVKSQE